MDSLRTCNQKLSVSFKQRTGKLRCFVYPLSPASRFRSSEAASLCKNALACTRSAEAQFRERLSHDCAPFLQSMVPSGRQFGLCPSKAMKGDVLNLVWKHFVRYIRRDAMDDLLSSVQLQDHHVGRWKSTCEDYANSARCWHPLARIGWRRV